MKSGVLFLAALLVSALTFTAKAQAKDLLADACVTGGPVVQSASLTPQDFQNLRLQAAYSDVDFYARQELAFQMPKLTCDNLSSAKDSITLVSLALMPARTALQITGVGAEIGASIAALGLATPAVIGVTVLGSAGLAVFYIVLKQKEIECRKQDQVEFKKQIFNELESKYGIHSLPSQQIQYQQ